MSARKPVHEDCNGSIDCPVEGHVKVGRGRWTRRFSHIPLTRGQQETLWERQQAAREEARRAHPE